MKSIVVKCTCDKGRLRNQAPICTKICEYYCGLKEGERYDDGINYEYEEVPTYKLETGDKVLYWLPNDGVKHIEFVRFTNDNRENVDESEATQIILHFKEKYQNGTNTLTCSKGCNTFDMIWKRVIGKKK